MKMQQPCLKKPSAAAMPEETLCSKKGLKRRAAAMPEEPRLAYMSTQTPPKEQITTIHVQRDPSNNVISVWAQKTQ